MVRERSSVAVRLVVEGAFPPPRVARAALFRRLLSDGEPALAAELHRREQIIPAARRGGFHHGTGAPRDPARARNGAAHGTGFTGLFQPGDAEPMAAL